MSRRIEDSPTIGELRSSRGCTKARFCERQEPGTSETYAKKLVSRTIDAILELSKHRLAVRKRTERKNGLEYTERRVILPPDADIPGETKSE